MAPPWDVLGVGAAMGCTIGLYGGYQLHKLVLYIQDWRAWRAERITKTDKTVMLVEHHEMPPTIPLKRAMRSAPQMPAPEVSANPDRDDVIAALMGAGYKKVDASKAADACTLVERASGLRQWTIAALRNAHGSKS